MIEEISFLVALIGSSIAAVWDLKTTEIPDQIPHIMMIVGILLSIGRSIVEGSYLPLVWSLGAGFGLLFFGFLLYYFGQWGGGDAKILSAIAFLVPITPRFFSKQLLFPFPISYLLNVLYVGAGYMILYSVFIALMNKKVILTFKNEIKASAKLLLVAAVLLFVFFLVLTTYVSSTLFLDFRLPIWYSVVPVMLFIVFWFIWQFAKTVEEVGFKKRIPVSKLKVGDVLLEAKQWEGLTAEEVRKIKKSGKKYVVIKEGVRFGLAFPLALLFTYYFGDGIAFFVRYFV